MIWYKLLMQKILVVDDDRDMLEMMELCLKLHHFTVEVATCREELMDRLHSFKPDLLILDVMLGLENGRSICKELKQSAFKNIPVLLYSAVSVWLKDFEECEASAVLEKPFNIKTMLNTVKALLDNKAAATEE